VEEEAPKGLAEPIEPAKEQAAAPAKPEPAKPEPATTETVRSQPEKPEVSARPVEATKPAEGPAQSANAVAAKGQVNEALPPSLRRDPVPAVTPAPAEPSVTAPAESASPPLPPVSH
jgi:hypothetical protein